jgi:hypothetical protein
LSVSYFEIGGHIVECLLDTPDISHHGQTAQARKTDRLLMKTSRKAAIEGVDKLVGDRYDVKRGMRGGQKVRAGSTSVATGLKIARWAMVAAAADGPLPIGDVIAAGILLGGGAYMIHEGMQDIKQ